MKIEKSAQAAKPDGVVSLRTLLAVVGDHHAARVSLRDEIGQVEVQGLVRRVGELLRLGRKTLTLDLAGVNHWDYRTLPELCRLVQRVARAGGEVRFVGANRYIETIFRFGGLESLLSSSRLALDRPGGRAVAP